MVDTKKEQERDELHRAIWAIADELRGAVDGWDFKNYVLGTMFYRYISENMCNYINSGEIDAGNTDFDFAKMPDEDAEEIGQNLVLRERHLHTERGRRETVAEFPRRRSDCLDTGIIIGSSQEILFFLCSVFSQISIQSGIRQHWYILPYF